MDILMPERRLPVREEAQVLVVGGGPAGIGAAIASARMGRRTTLLEKRGFLGGNITASYVESCNYFMRGTGFHAQGFWEELESGYDAAFPSDDLRPDSPHRFNSELLKVYLDRLMRSEGINLKLHAFVNEAVVKDGRIAAVVVQTKQGPQAITANIIIDCTGDADVAAAAGVPFHQGRERETDGLCQPGTVSVRLAGANVESLLRNGDGLRALSRRFRDEYRAGRTGLPCKRQDLPFGRLTRAGVISYVNYACAYGIDPTDIDDLTRGETECRQYALDIWRYMRANYPGMENTEIASIAPEIGFRDSRRIEGEYTLTIDDMEGGKRFSDCIAVYPRFYDMLSPDANMDGDGSVTGKGYRGHIYEPVTGGRSFQIPYRSLLPVDIDNLLVAGRCISCEHVAQSGVRAISLCAMTGEAAGVAAGMSYKDGVSPRRADVSELQRVLRSHGFTIPL